MYIWTRLDPKENPMVRKRIDPQLAQDTSKTVPHKRMRFFFIPKKRILSRKKQHFMFIFCEKRQKSQRISVNFACFPKIP